MVRIWEWYSKSNLPMPKAIAGHPCVSRLPPSIGCGWSAFHHECGLRATGTYSLSTSYAMRKLGFSWFSGSLPAYLTIAGDQLAIIPWFIVIFSVELVG